MSPDQRSELYFNKIDESLFAMKDAFFSVEQLSDN